MNPSKDLSQFAGLAGPSGSRRGAVTVWRKAKFRLIDSILHPASSIYTGCLECQSTVKRKAHAGEQAQRLSGRAG